MMSCNQRIVFFLWPLLFLQVSGQIVYQSHLFPKVGKPRQLIQEGRVRLVGDLSSAGRVEIYHDGQWGTVCDDGWDLVEAQVVCRQLGFPGAVSAVQGGRYGEGSGSIWLDDLKCKGSESLLSECSFKGWGVSDCSHKEDAGVVCQSGTNTTNLLGFPVDHSLGLSDDLGLLFDREDGCDFNIIVQDLSEESQTTFCVHRVILMIFPELNITNDTSNMTVDISQSCHSHVPRFLRYLYTRRIDVSSESAQCLHQLAFIFGVKKLMEDVGRVFTALIPEDSSFQTQLSMFEYSLRTGDLVLQENVLQYLSWNCEFLISSPVWSTISFHMMDALLQRSDLVLKDEAYLLEALGRWIQVKGDEISQEQQAGLLSHIRFPLIPVDKLYDLQFSSSVLHKSHEKLFLTGLLSGFQFNSLPFYKIRSHLDNTTSVYLPRIYTGDAWSVFMNVSSYKNPHYYNNDGRYRSFSTPAHPSALYREQNVQWQAQVFNNFQECLNSGFRCNSLPVARILPTGNQERYTSRIRYNNRLILTCKKKNNVFHVQDFKNNIAVIPVNSSMNANILSIQFSVDNSLGLSGDLGLLFDREDGCDFSITVRDLGEESQLTFCVHRMILMSFPELNITKDSDNLTVDISQSCQSHVPGFLRYLYTRRIDVSSESAQCLHQLAFIFGVKKLMEDVGRVFTALIPEDSSFQTQLSMFEYSLRTGDLVLQENVLQYLSWNCEFFISSPVWSTISFHMMDALLQRSDLVLKDEAYLLEALERWIQVKGDEISQEQQAGLLSHIRFPLIPVDKLYDLQFSSSVLHKNQEILYLTGLLSGFEFNSLAFSKIRSHLDNTTSEYLPRIYTGDDWCVFINDTTIVYPYYNYYGQSSRYQIFYTPEHPSALYKDKRFQWQAWVYLTFQECSNYGVSCNSLPTARLTGYQYSNSDTIRYSNKLILSCKNENNVFHVQDFKNDLVEIPGNSTMGWSNPCPDSYNFRFVVSPQYI
ncbi:hypothetical protein DNTS_033942 [Danionella cerebrum]|uniref:SRCR domain-containing protein n=1 Tax=Danionella cerebrum TaxID=2873325 RepID=A0A553PZT9_9TELE|nr:hypothetical protein DNTS_033942 [Danionella translucida]